MTIFRMLFLNNKMIEKVNNHCWPHQNHNSSSHNRGQQYSRDKIWDMNLPWIRLVSLTKQTIYCSYNPFSLTTLFMPQDITIELNLLKLHYKSKVSQFITLPTVNLKYSITFHIDNIRMKSISYNHCFNKSNTLLNEKLLLYDRTSSRFSLHKISEIFGQFCGTFPVYIKISSAKLNTSLDIHWWD